MEDKNASEVLSDFYKDEIRVEDLKSEIGEAVSESYREISRMKEEKQKKK